MQKIANKDAELSVEGVCTLSDTDTALLRRLREGDTAAFDVLFERHRRGLLAYVSAWTGDRALAEDIVQESFLRLVTRVDRIDPRRGVAPWLYRVARNRAIDVLRHRKFEAPDGRAVLESAAATGEPSDQAAMRAEDAERVRRALAKLTEREREVLTLRFYGGLTFADIARVVRRPLGTVLWMARRSLGRMRGMMTSGE